MAENGEITFDRKTSQIEDSVHWKHTANGDFSVSSAYREQTMGGFQTTNKWEKIWELKCPGKLKVFLWKTLHGVLPTASFLANRRLGSNIACFRCLSHEESTLHALRDCTQSKLVWLSLIPSLLTNTFFILELDDWILVNITSKRESSGLLWSVLFVVAAWYIWYWRNKQLHEKDFQWPANAVQLIWNRAKLITNVLQSFNSKLKYTEKIQWQRPAQGHVKMNVDASRNNLTGEAAAGGVLRDSNGDWILGFTYKVGISNILGAELWGIYQGLLICWNEGYKQVEVETDSLMATKQIQGLITAFDINGHLLRTIQGILQRNWQCNIKHVLRETNVSADGMAKLGYRNPGLTLLVDPPESIICFLRADSMGVIRHRLM